MLIFSACQERRNPFFKHGFSTFSAAGGQGEDDDGGGQMFALHPSPMLQGGGRGEYYRAYWL